MIQRKLGSAAVKDLQYLQDTTGRAFQWSGNELNVNLGKFKSVAVINGISFYFMIDPLKDDPARNKLRHPKGGLASSYEYDIMGFGSMDEKANMKIVGAVEYAVVLYRDKLPKFRNGVKQDDAGKNIRGTGRMIKNWFEWEKDNKKDYPKIHPTQKPVNVLKELIQIFTDEGDVVIDPCAGSATTLRAARELRRHGYGFEIDKTFYKDAQEKMLTYIEDNQLTFF